MSNSSCDPMDCTYTRLFHVGFSEQNHWSGFCSFLQSSQQGSGRVSTWRQRFASGFTEGSCHVCSVQSLDVIISLPHDPMNPSSHSASSGSGSSASSYRQVRDRPSISSSSPLPLILHSIRCLPARSTLPR